MSDDSWKIADERIESFASAVCSALPGREALAQRAVQALLDSGPEVVERALLRLLRTESDLQHRTRQLKHALDALEAMVRRYCDRPDPKDEQEVTPGGVLVTPSGEEEAHNAITLLWHHGRADYEDPENAIWRLRPVGGEDA